MFANIYLWRYHPHLLSSFWLWEAVTHLVPNAYGPGHLVPYNCSLLTNGSQTIQSPWTNWPQKFGPYGKMVPRIFHLYTGTGFGDPGIWGPHWLGTICPLGPNFWGPLVHGDRLWWGLFVEGDQFYGDHLSRGTESRGLEVRGSNGFGTKCIAAFETVYFLFGKGQEKKVFTTDLCLAHSGRNQCDEKETTISSSGGRINCSILGTG